MRVGLVNGRGREDTCSIIRPDKRGAGRRRHQWELDGGPTTSMSFHNVLFLLAAANLFYYIDEEYLLTENCRVSPNGNISEKITCKLGLYFGLVLVFCMSPAGATTYCINYEESLAKMTKMMFASQLPLCPGYLNKATLSTNLC